MRTSNSFSPIKSRQGPALSVILTGFSVGLLVLSLAAGSVDARLLDGVPVWAKPAKFAASFVVLFATIAWLETRLSEQWRKSWLVRGTLSVMALCMVAEMGYIMMQAGLGEASHFNFSTPFHSFMYTAVMAFGAVLLVVGIGICGFVAWVDKDAALTPALRLAIALGFGASFLLTFFIAGYIGGQGSSFVGSPGADHLTLPLFGWSAEVGDFRPAHFLALHAMQVVPLLAAVFDRYAASRRQRLVVIVTGVYAFATLGLFTKALAGKPLIAL